MTKWWVLLAISAFLLVSACTPVTHPLTAGGLGIVQNHSVSGTIQKGPFVQGSQVIVSQLDSDFSPTGSVYFTKTINDGGDFSIECPQSGYAEVSAVGYYYNENSGLISDNQLTLYALIDLSQDVCNVNLITTLIEQRIKHLMKNESSDFRNAEKQAVQELLRFFRINNPNSDDPAKMDIVKSTESNGVLLAISLILQGQRSTGELSELVAKIAVDLAPDGIIDTNRTYIDAKLKNAMIPAYDWIDSNLLKRYRDLGRTVTLPDYRKFIDPGFVNNGEIQSHSLNMVRQYFAGTWKGTVNTPWDPWLEYNGQITFKSDGTYSVKSIDHAPVLYYGSDEDSIYKTYSVTAMNADGIAEGTIAITWPYTDDANDISSDKLSRIRFSDGFNTLKFELLHLDKYGPITFVLKRVP